MHALFDKVDAIELKIRQLTHKIESLEREKGFLLNENANLKKDLNQYIDKIEGLQKRIDSIKDERLNNKEDFKRRIKHLKEDVAECIEILNT